MLNEQRVYETVLNQAVISLQTSLADQSLEALEEAYKFESAMREQIYVEQILRIAAETEMNQAA